MTLTRDQILQKAAEAEAAAERFAGGGDTYATMNASAYRQRAADWRARAAEMPALATTTAAAVSAGDPALRAAIEAARAGAIAKVRAEAIAAISANDARAELDAAAAQIASFNPRRPIVAVKSFSTGDPLADAVAAFAPRNRISAARTGTPLADPAAEALAQEIAAFGQHKEASGCTDDVEAEAQGIAAFMPQARRT
jgi:hypothetical protein